MNNASVKACGRSVCGGVSAWCAVALMLLMLAGCRSSKPAATHPVEDNTQSAVTNPFDLQTPQQRYEALCATYGEWDDVSLPVKISLATTKKIGFSARAVMKRNEWIDISVRMLGLEVATVWIDNDSIHAVDKYHKLYLSEDLSKVFAGEGFNVGNIQDLLMGRGFLAGNDGGTLIAEFTRKIALTAQPEGVFVLPVGKGSGHLSYGFLLAPDSDSVLVTSVKTSGGVSGVAVYSAYAETPSGKFASKADFSIESKKAKASIEWKFGSAKWNTNVSQQWKSPSSEYKRIRAADLLKVLTEM